MRIEQFIKKLNNTELGLANTNEHYARIPNHVDFLDTWTNDSNNGYLTFLDRLTQENVRINCSIGRERRLVSSKLYFHEQKNLRAGDKIIFEKRTDSNGSNEFIIDTVNFTNKVLFLKRGSRGQNRFTLMNLERIEALRMEDGTYQIRVRYDNTDYTLQIMPINEQGLREDSPSESTFYQLLFNNTSLDDISNLRGNKDYLELIIGQGNNELHHADMFQYIKYSF